MENTSKEKRRLMMRFDQNVREINRAVINPLIETLSLKELEPIMRMVAHARADYLRVLMALADDTQGQATPTDVGELKTARERYEELIAAVGALETMIERGYVDVSNAPG